MNQYSRVSAWSIFGVFLIESAVLGQWIPRIPDIKQALDLSDQALGIALLCLPLGTLLVFPLAGRLIELTGLRLACRLFLPIWAVTFTIPAFAQNFWQLLVALALCGIAVGLIETAMNTKASEIENATGVRLMSRCHGFWSLGTMFGALTGGWLAQAEVTLALHFLMVMPALAIVGFIIATALPADSQREQPGNEQHTHQISGWFHLPDRQLLLLCLMPVGVLMVEGAFIDWSAVFMDEVLMASPMITATTYAFFSVIMAAVRLMGDSIASRLGDVLVVRLSGILAMVGMLMFALATSIGQAFAGAAIAGAGVAIAFPLAVSAAANRPGGSAARNVASLSLIAFSAFLLAPPLIGFLSDVVGLRYALLLLAPLAFTSYLLAPEVRASKPQ